MQSLKSKSLMLVQNTCSFWCKWRIFNYCKTNDILVFVSKEHQVRKITINPKLFTNDELVVELILKAEELNEVVITNMPSIKISKNEKWEQDSMNIL
jgi:hypothetical protein